MAKLDPVSPPWGGISRPRPSLERRRGQASADPARRLAGVQRGIAAWAVGNAWYAIFLSVIPAAVATRIGWLTDYVLLLSCLLQFLVGSMLLRLPLRLPVAGVMVSLFMVWLFATTLLANSDLGRPLYSPIQYYTTWGLLFVMLYVAVDQGVYISAMVRRWILLPWIGVLFLSGLVAILQLAGVGWSRSIAPQNQVANLFRPNGLTDYTFALGAQSLIGAMLVGMWLRERALRWFEWGLVAFFLFIVLAAQYRSLYYTGISVAWVTFIVLQLRRDRNKGLLLIVAAAASIVLPLALFPAKFAYGMRGSANDPALLARFKSWSQVGPVLQDRPLTGIGADQNLMLVTNKANIDHWSGTVIDNFYRMVLITTGYVGAILAGLALLTIMIGLFMRYDSARSPAVRVYSLCAIVLMISLLGVSNTGNSFVYGSVSYPLAILLAFGATTWRERQEGALVSPFVAWVRTLAHSPLRALFPGFSRLR